MWGDSSIKEWPFSKEGDRPSKELKHDLLESPKKSPKESAYQELGTLAGFKRSRARPVKLFRPNVLERKEPPESP